MTIREPSPDTSLVNRYGGQKRALPIRKKILIGGAGLALGVAFAIWVVFGQGDSVSFNDVGYSTTDATRTEVDFDVTKPAADTAECAVKAMDESFAVVGWQVVTIGPNDVKAGTDAGQTTSHRVALRTQSSAVSGMVDSCWIAATPR